MRRIGSSVGSALFAPLSLAFMLLGTGCASTEMHSFVDPDFRGHTYRSLVVSVQVEQLDQRDVAESRFAKTFGAAAIPTKRALDLLPPTQQYDDSGLKQELAKSGADGLLIVRMTQYYEDEEYVAPQTHSYTTGTLNASTYYHDNHSSTYGTANSSTHSFTTGGYTVKKPRVRHELQLWDISSGKMAWIGGTFTKGNAYAQFDNMIDPLADETAKAFTKEGLVVVAK